MHCSNINHFPVAIAILSFYGGIGLLIKFGSSSKKPATIEATPAAAIADSTSGSVPALESPAFESFVGTAAFEALLADGDQLAKLLESAA
jgi:hypothetical protein